MPRALDVGDAGAARRGARLRDGRARREERAGDARGHRGDGRRSCATAIRAGALGFSTSRTIVHQRRRRRAGARHLRRPRTSCSASARVLGELGTGLFELAPAGVMGEDLSAPEREVEWMRRLSAEIGRPVTFALSQHDLAPDQWRALLRLAEEAQRRRRRPPRRRWAGARSTCSSGSRPSTRSSAARRYAEDRRPAARRAGAPSCASPRSATRSSPRRRPTRARSTTFIGDEPRRDLPARRAAGLRARARARASRRSPRARAAIPRRCSTT